MIKHIVEADCVPADLDDNRCAVCLELVKEKTTPLECNHDFCFPCIWAWADKMRVCPMCKTEFTHLQKFGDDGKLIEKIYLEPIPKDDEPEEPEYAENWYVCETHENED